MSVAEMSLYGTALIAAVFIIRSCFFYSIPKRALTLLWELAILRLLVPFSVSSRFSLYSLFASLKTDALSEVAYVPAVTYRTTMQMPVKAYANIPTYFSVETMLFWIWLTGFGMLILYFTAIYIHSAVGFKTSLPIRNDYIEAWKNNCRLQRSVDVRCSDRIASPLTYSVFHPVILLPQVMAEDEKSLRYILAHEMEHIRNFDAVKKPLCVLAVCLHWFNPFVWAMMYFFSRDLELACDEGALNRLRTGNKSDYAKTLIEMEAIKSGIVPFASYFTGHAAEERIKAIMKMKRKSIIANTAAAVIVCITATAMMTSAQTKTPDTEKSLTQINAVNEVNVVNEGAKIPQWAEYERFGLSRDAQGRLYFNGKAVRIFWDGTMLDGNMLTRYFNFDEKGEIDVRTVWKPKRNDDGSNELFGTLVGLEETAQLNPEDFCPSLSLEAEATIMTSDDGDVVVEKNAESETTLVIDFSEAEVEKNSESEESLAIEFSTAEGSSDVKGRTVPDIFEQYSRVGIVYDEENNMVLWNGKPVEVFVDYSNSGVFTFRSPKISGKAVSVRTVYKNGKVTAIRELTEEEKNADFIEW